MKRTPKPPRPARRPGPVICPSCAATCISAAERDHHHDCRDARHARKRGERPR